MKSSLKVLWIKFQDQKRNRSVVIVGVGEIIPSHSKKDKFCNISKNEKMMLRSMTINKIGNN